MPLLQIAPAESWGDAVRGSISEALALLLEGIPRVLAFALIALAGWLTLNLVAKLVDRLLETVQFDAFADRAGVSGFVYRTGIDADASTFVAELARWFIRLIALVAAFDALGIPAVSEVLREFLRWLPELLVAIVVLVLTGLAATAVAELVRGATAQGGLDNPELLARVGSTAVWLFGVVIAVN
ncbi:MAG: hypothetical protein FJ035_07175 [Chloroflexi bacterium]|nr:hypothetical protein [Chloroflexota bacterium]